MVVPIRFPMHSMSCTSPSGLSSGWGNHPGSCDASSRQQTPCADSCVCWMHTMRCLFRACAAAVSCVPLYWHIREGEGGGVHGLACFIRIRARRVRRRPTYARSLDSMHVSVGEGGVVHPRFMGLRLCKRPNPYGSSTRRAPRNFQKKTILPLQYFTQ